MDKNKIIIYIVVGSFFIIFLFIFYIRADRIENSYQFKGIVQKITYGDKGTPKVIINDNAYFLSFPDWSFNNKIEQGDSLIKRKNSRIYKLIKHKTKEVIFSK